MKIIPILFFAFPLLTSQLWAEEKGKPVSKPVAKEKASKAKAAKHPSKERASKQKAAKEKAAKERAAKKPAKS